MNWENWGAHMLDDSDKQKRFDSARTAATSPTSIDVAGKKGVFPGSGKSPYETTLDNCTCVDFVRRKLPCKHMYRLALELGVIKGNWVTGKNKNTHNTENFSFDEIEQLSDDSKRFLYRLCNDEKYRDVFEWFLHTQDVPTDLVDGGFCVADFVDCSDLPLYSIKRGMVELGYTLGEDGVPAKGARSTTTLNWLSEHPTVSPQISKMYMRVLLTERTREWKSSICKHIYDALIYLDSYGATVQVTPLTDDSGRSKAKKIYLNPRTGEILKEEIVIVRDDIDF